MARISVPSKPLKAFWVAVALCLLPWAALAADLPPYYQDSRGRLALRGQGTLRYALVFEVYSAGLYLPADTPSGQVLADTPKRLELHYNYDISSQRIIESKKEILARNWPPNILAAEKDNLELINRNYVDVRPGDSYALTYWPGRGTELSLNGRVQVTIPGARFAALMFSIWLGKDPLDADLRDVLLGYD